MKSIVIYFSITGNTKKIAQAIQRGLSHSGTPCDMADIKEIGAEDLAEYDLIGLGSPVMWLREPAIVMQFIEYTMKYVQGKHGFAFSTHGALPAHYLSRVVPALTLFIRMLAFKSARTIWASSINSRVAPSAQASDADGPQGMTS